MSDLVLQTIKVEPKQQASACVIWLHGLGADGHDFEPIVPELRLPQALPIRFIFPHSPKMPVTINGGMVMPAWYDILDMSVERKVDVAQLTQSATAVQALVDEQIASGIPAERIILAGFSQGGAVAYQAALTYPKTLGGLLTMSTYFATKDSIQLNDANRNIDICIMHGSQDPVVNPVLGTQAKSVLETLGFNPEYYTYPMPHSVCAPQVRDISDWLQQRLS
ncbi:alpha/beta hydrolase [Thalassotalea sp. PS06]|uniref:alpha/beta hydrolase n=1 Tax=Thalassotalea sp. PS06 TaxID=2594005 RepID=UPI001165886A|nr:carboxylesterase [Thalassotalea sp. PS06]QDP00405.1 carboxylesterase [Thalassotalea sp. PS06]